VQSLKRLPGLGYRSAEKVALYLLVEKPDSATALIDCLQEARRGLGPCVICGNLAEGSECTLCLSDERDQTQLCVVEGVTDLFAMERAGVFRGLYHVLHGKLSPIRGFGPDKLNLTTLRKRLTDGHFKEVILALGNDLEGDATSHYLHDEILSGHDLSVTRIGFGLPSGAGLTYADEVTLKSSLEGRKSI